MQQGLKWCIEIHHNAVNAMFELIKTIKKQQNDKLFFTSIFHSLPADQHIVFPKAKILF